MLDEAQDVLLCESSQLWQTENKSPEFIDHSPMKRLPLIGDVPLSYLITGG
jgi:hypothetical protein